MRRLLFLLTTLLAAPALHAQAVEIYGTLSDVHATNVPTNVPTPYVCPVNVLPCTTPPPTYAGVNAFNPGGGVTVNFLRLPVLKLGVDVRGSHHTGTNGANTALAGLKLTVKPPAFRASPYLQGSAGYLGTSYNGVSGGSTPPATHSYFVTELLAGIDLPLLSILDLRLIEIGGGHALNSAGGSKPTFLTIGSGLVLHF